MKSAGNDIIALKAIDMERTKSYPFYSKIITASEQSLYHNQFAAAMPFEIFVWLLWSVKEPVYKYLQRGENHLVFSPAKIVIQDLSIGNVLTDFGLNDGLESDGIEHCNGSVLFKDSMLYFRSKITGEYINTIVNDDEDFDDVYWGTGKITPPFQANQSVQVRELASKRIRDITNCASVGIEKDIAGYPVVFIGGKQTDIPLSLAHHDCFMSYSFFHQND